METRCRVEVRLSRLNHSKAGSLCSSTSLSFSLILVPLCKVLLLPPSLSLLLSVGLVGSAVLCFSGTCLGLPIDLSVQVWILRLWGPSNLLFPQLGRSWFLEPGLSECDFWKPSCFLK
ncbi:hypothetical protein RJT34_15063 [Clitoria ternatea]|uniref:Uncharacterized protein n=1 Tax=Clitoria ternatea TaxID=43366 RepID=A0AAN9PLK8_CLITE